MEEAVTHAPSLSHEAAELERQHPKLLKLLDRLIDKLRSTPKSIRRIEKEYHQLVQKICDHEAAYREVQSQAISYTTGVPAMIGAKMMLTDKWRAEVLSTEQRLTALYPFNPAATPARSLRTDRKRRSVRGTFAIEAPAPRIARARPMSR